MADRQVPGLCFRVAVVVLLTLVIAGCATGISQKELRVRLQDKQPPRIVDVRSRGEYAGSHVPGAVHIPFYAIGAGLTAKGHDKTAPVVLYCEHGPRAGLAALVLYLQGYEEVYSLEGHMKVWRANGLPVESGGP